MRMALTVCKIWFFCDKNWDKLSFCVSWDWNLRLFFFLLWRFCVLWHLKDPSFQQPPLEATCNYCCVLPSMGSAKSTVTDWKRFSGETQFCLFSVWCLFSFQFCCCFLSEPYCCYRQISAFAVLNLKNGSFSNKQLLFFKMAFIILHLSLLRYTYVNEPEKTFSLISSSSLVCSK